MSDSVFAADGPSIVPQKTEGPSRFERIMNPETDENCKVPVSAQIRQYSVGVGKD